MELGELLLVRIKKSQQRLAELRAEGDEEQTRLKKWLDAYELETNKQPSRPSEDVSPVSLPSLTLDSIRTKESMITSLLEHHPNGLKSAHIIQALFPAISRASVYGILKKMGSMGRVEQTESGLFRLTSDQKEKEAPMTETS